MNHWIKRWQTVGIVGFSLVLVEAALAADEANPPTDNPTAQTEAKHDREINAKDRDTEHHAGMHKELVVRQLSKLNAGDVYGNDGKKVGHIKGLAVDTARNRIAYAVIEFDNLADLADKQFAVPWAALDKKTNEKDAEKLVYSMNANRDQLKTAKGIDKDNWPDMAQLRGEDTRALWNVQPYWSAKEQAAARTDQTEVNKNGEPADSSRLHGTPISTDPGMIVKVSDLDGHRVLDENGNDVAKLHCALADTHSGRLTYGVLQLDKSDALNPVPFEILQISSTGKDQSKFGTAKDAAAFKVSLNTPVDKVKAGPKFQEREWPTMNGQWGEEVYNAYGVKPFWTKSHMKKTE